MRTVYKYFLPAPLRPNFSVPIPDGAEILSAGTSDGRPCLWALVDPDKPVVDREFLLRDTGEPIDEAVLPRLSFVGTFSTGGGNWYVGHLFEVDRIDLHPKVRR